MEAFFLPYTAQNGQKGSEEKERAKEPLLPDLSVPLTCSSPRRSFSDQTVQRHRSGEKLIDLKARKWGERAPKEDKEGERGCGNKGQTHS